MSAQYTKAQRRKLVKAWIAALRSGKYKQCRNRMHDENADAHCCLGVAHLVLGGKPSDLNSYKAVKEAMGLRGDLGQMKSYTNRPMALAYLNDGSASSSGHPRSFGEIADIIELNLKTNRDKLFLEGAL